MPAAWWREGWSDWEILGLPYCAKPSPPLTVAALIAFYRSANGDNWRYKDNWLSDAPLNTWYGVTTDKSGRVTGQELPYNGLSGTLPSELGTLDHLERLLLHGNALRGEIPPELGNLSSLTRLSLWNNQLDGMIPSELGNLTNLLGLSLSGNQLSGCVPATWRNVVESDLEEIGLPYCAAP